ncbi:HD family hydrolase [Algimonas porphyrae]|uniref:Metal-dependent phosphohydrolase n=1 Tax=Algimonas porphyrae TaxID=1128113 RepID=A0ABQ5V0A2_9PROT|nr:HD family hydrolase [Algimonas porphyrae]GLQ20866.1 metal-dependent phosphohydrolase [Algimonas porphyrae]
MRARRPARAWQRMLSGRRLDLLDPSPLDIEIEDIARGLARVARWNGQTSGDHAFSVAEHSVVVLDLFVQLYPATSAHDRMSALLHDAAEYVVGDMISPFKAVLGDDYKAVEARLDDAVNRRFGLSAPTPTALKKKIKRCDIICAWFEATQIAGFTVAEADQCFITPPDGLHVTIDPKPVVKAEDLFLARFAELKAALS